MVITIYVVDSENVALNNWFIRQRAFIEKLETQLLRIFRALQTSQVLHISMNTQLTYEPIVL